MAKSNSTANTRTEPIDVLPPDSNGVIAAWDGLYWAFGARAESFDVVPEGLAIKGLTFDSGHADPATIIADVNHKGRRVPLFPAINWINGQEPAPFATAQEMTAYMVNHFRGSVDADSTKSAKYVRDAFSALKGRQGIVSKRGPKTKTINLKNLASVNASTLKAANVSREDLETLLAAVSAAVAETPPTEITAD